MLIDGFTFFNEIDVLKIRLSELYPFVDKFILVEGSKTQSGNDKPFYFEDNKHLFKEYLDKIEHVKVDNWPERTSAWDFDIFQRNCIADGFEKIGVRDDDIIMVSDVDEIPFPSALNKISATELKIFKMYYNVYRWNLRFINFFWNGTVTAPWKIAKQFGMHSFIKLRDANLPVEVYIQPGGNHYGYQGGAKLIRHKYFSCVEPFDKMNGIPNEEEFLKIFEERAIDGGSFIFSDNLARTDIKLEKCELKDLHETILKEERYKKFLL